ncbi:MAG: alpha/beta fold hydrolase [Simplicispira sp.]|nr:alpha/beta fold hydrolase [Simplicispira sp.]
MLDLPLTFLKRPAAPGTPWPWLLVLMHGVGSNERDLFSLAGQVPDRFCVLSLRAPYTLGPGSYSWFDFSVDAAGARAINAAQEAASRAQLEQLLAMASQQLDIPPERVVVGGFSQGGIMALSLLLTRPDLLHAAMVWHSRLLPEVVALSAPADALRGHALWVSHGTHDNVIPLAHAHAIRDHLQTLPVRLSYQEFPGMHEIRPAELAQSLAWLKALDTAPQ